MRVNYDKIDEILTNIDVILFDFIELSYKICKILLMILFMAFFMKFFNEEYLSHGKDIVPYAIGIILSIVGFFLMIFTIKEKSLLLETITIIFTKLANISARGLEARLSGIIYPSNIYYPLNENKDLIFSYNIEEKIIITENVEFPLPLSSSPNYPHFYHSSGIMPISESFSNEKTDPNKDAEFIFELNAQGEIFLRSLKDKKTIQYSYPTQDPTRTGIIVPIFD